MPRHQKLLEVFCASKYAFHMTLQNNCLASHPFQLTLEQVTMPFITQPFPHTALLSPSGSVLACSLSGITKVPYHCDS